MLPGSKGAVGFKYYGDGTGRDSYVVVDSGGLIPKYSNKGPNSTFYNSLRQPDPKNQSYVKQKYYKTNPRGERIRDKSQPWFSQKVRDMIKSSY